MATYQDNITRYRNNPSAVMRDILKELQAGSGKELVPNPTNPFIFALETAVALADDNLTQLQTTMQYVYPAMASTWDQLYNHMSDRDYRDVFSKPGVAPYMLFFDLEELYASVVQVPNTNTAKLVIPAKSKFTFAETTFTLLYPIEIRVKSGTSIQVVYDVSNPSPLQKITNNIVDWTTKYINGRRNLVITFPVYQLDVIAKIAKTSQASGLKQTYQFTDQYHYCRAYRNVGNDNWVEMETSHTIQVFDPTVPTVLLRVEDNTLHAHIPPIYFSNGLINDSVRFEIYTTKGDVTMELNSYNANSFTAVWGLDELDRNRYTAPMDTIKQNAVLGTGVLSGGRNSVTFEELRERVINGTLRNIEVPITNIELTTALMDLGYAIVTDVDNTTRRIFQATRRLPQPANQSTTSGIGSRIGKVFVKMEELPQYGTVVDNGNRVTILPTTLYNENNGIIIPNTAARTDAILAMAPEQRIAEVMANNFLYSPFHYVLDANDDIFEVRPYYLDAPIPTDKYFVEENDTTELSVSTGELAIERVDNGFMLMLSTLSGVSFKALDPTKMIVQLSYTPTGETLQAHMLGTYYTTLENGEFVFQFNITSDFDVTPLHDILLTSFKVIDATTDRKLPTSLTTEFDVRYGILDYTTAGMEFGPITGSLATYMIDTPYDTLVGLSHERLTIQFGSALTGLWSSARTIVSDEDYVLYESDVYSTHPNDVYETIPGTSAIKYYEINGELKRNKLHSAGDPILDELGQPLIKHLAGTVKKDEFGNPIIKNQRALQRELNLFLLDGAYRFATEDETVAYRDTVPQYLIDWLNNDIVPMKEKVHEESWLFYYPQTTIGKVDVIVDDDEYKTIDSEQFLRFKIYVDKSTHSNTALRLTIIDQIKTTVSTALNNSSVSASVIIESLQQELKDVIRSITMSGLAGELEASQITMVDDSQRLTMGKTLILRQDGKITIEDGFSIDFILHRAT